MAERDITLKRPTKCGQCQFWQETGELRFGEPVGKCHKKRTATYTL